MSGQEDNMDDKGRKTPTQTPEMRESTSNPRFSADRSSANLNRKPSTSSIPNTRKMISSQTSSNTASPKPSREPSPARPTVRPSTTRPGPGRPRKNSSQDLSPSRSASATTPNVPSSAAIQRALSAASTPLLKPALSDLTIIAPQPYKPMIPSEIKETPRWPISPRLRSPPPVNRPSNMPRKSDQDTPVSTLRFTSSNEGTATDTDNEESSAMVAIRSPARGASTSSTTLETVQEISQPNTPASGLDATLSSAMGGLAEEPIAIDQVLINSQRKLRPGAVESGSESGERKGEIKLRSTTGQGSALRSSLASPLKPTSSTSMTSVKKASEGSTTKNMTVETETVSSIPQVAVGGGATVNGSLRAKPSSETIRPKKERKRTARKAPSVTSGVGKPPHSSTRPQSRLHHHSSNRSMSDASLGMSPSDSSHFATGPGRFASAPPVPDFRLPSLSSYVNRVLMMPPRTASSKADIFEAKIASAVDEANSSDSEETFVYESNPPDHERPRRYHSRTPSATSMVSQIDQRGITRSMHANLEASNGHSVAMKKSMKFASSFNPPDSGGGDDDGTGSNRTNMGTGRGTIRHHHIGRWGRNGTSGHASLFDNESPFANAAKSKFGGNAASRQSSRPTSPRISIGKFGNKKNSPISSGYDIDDGAGADDERTPLMPTSLRSARSGRHRRPLTASSRHLEHQGPRRNASVLTRFAGCLVLSIMVLLVMSGAIGFLFATTQPLLEVKIVALKKVLASQQELMFDIEVQARNPNIMAVSIDTLSMSVYARSKYAGGDGEWYARAPQEGPRMRRGTRMATQEEGSWDPLPDDPDGRPLLLLGRVESLDNALIFDGSPFRHVHAVSTGEVRLAKPGNGTEERGRERWERIIKHEFELVVQGVLRYQLPLSQRARSAQVGGTAVVEPDGTRGDAGTGRPHWEDGAGWDEVPVYDEPGPGGDDDR